GGGGGGGGGCGWERRGWLRGGRDGGGVGLAPRLPVGTGRRPRCRGRAHDVPSLGRRATKASEGRVGLNSRARPAGPRLTDARPWRIHAGIAPAARRRRSRPADYDRGRVRPQPATRKRGSSMTEGPVLIHVWAVEPAAESTAVQRLEELFADESTTDPGFVSARVLESDDRTSLAAVIEMRSVEDRRRIEQLPEVR